MDILNNAYITEQHKIAAGGAWIWLLEIATAGLSPTTYRYTNNNARDAVSNRYSTTWNGNKYWSMPLSMDDVNFSTSGEFPEYRLQLGDTDINSALRGRIRDNAGLVGSTIRLMVVHSDHLDLTTPAIDELAEILNCELTAEAVIFTVGVPSLLSRRFPRDRYVPTFCRHKFTLALCQYVQPSNILTSTTISFIPGIDTDEPYVRYNTIWVNSGSLITSVFANAPGSYDDEGRWVLDNDTAFSIRGSLRNDGYFLADKVHFVRQQSVRVRMEVDGAKTFYEEAAGESISIQLGYYSCDHTLEACQLRDNTQNYGGSPGIVGGVYG